MPRGHSLSIYARFLGKKRTLLCMSREKGDHYYIQHGTMIFFFFSHYNLFLGNLKEKFARKVGVNTGRVYRVLKCDVIKMKFLKLWELSGYSVRTMPKRPICQK